MAGFGGQERVPCRENTEWMENYPASVISPSMLAPEMRRWGPATSQQELEVPLPTVRLLMQELEARAKRENVLVQELTAAERREAFLSVNLAASKTRQEELQRAAKEKETERSNLEAQIAEWKDMYASALTSYQGVEKEIRIKDMECKVAEQAEKAQIEELQSQLVAKEAQLAGKETELADKETELARKQNQLDDLAVTVSQKDVKILSLESQLDELAVTVSQKDAKISALQSQLAEAEEAMQAALDEMHHVISGTISILCDVSEQVFNLTVDLEDFQLRNKYGQKSTTPRTRPLQELSCTTGNLLSCGQESEKRIKCAQSALAGAAETWKKAEVGLEVMLSFGRKCLLDKILGKELACDAGEETSIEMDQI